MEARDQWVHFRIRDVHIPEPVQLLLALHGDDLLQGRVIAVTRGPDSEGRFAVVEVDGMKGPVVVSLERISISF